VYPKHSPVLFVVLSIQYITCYVSSTRSPAQPWIRTNILINTSFKTTFTILFHDDHCKHYTTIVQSIVMFPGLLLVHLYLTKHSHGSISSCNQHVHKGMPIVQDGWCFS